MPFRLLDFDQWAKPSFEHYTLNVVCACSLTVNLDIGGLAGYRLYPAMLWLLTDTVNELPEFRTALTAEGVGVYERHAPFLYGFQSGNPSFFGIWTAFSPDYPASCMPMRRMCDQCAQCTQFRPKADKTAEHLRRFHAPWTACSLPPIFRFLETRKHLLPIFTMGKVFPSDGEKIPLARFRSTTRYATGTMSKRFARPYAGKIDRFASGGQHRSRNMGQPCHQALFIL